MIATSSCRKTSSSSPSGQGNTDGTEDYLARKRARDRKSQRAMRDRTQWKIKELEAQVAYLVDRGATIESLLQTTTNENVTLKAERVSLTHQLDDLRFAATTDLCLDKPGLPIPTAHLDVWEQVPWNTPPTCVSDQILYGYIETQRSKMIESPRLFPDTEPDLSRLLLPAIAGHPKSLSTIIADIVLSYKEVDTLPMKIGGLYLIFKMLNVGFILLSFPLGDSGANIYDYNTNRLLSSG